MADEDSVRDVNDWQRAPLVKMGKTTAFTDVAFRHAQIGIWICIYKVMLMIKRQLPSDKYSEQLHSVTRISSFNLMNFNFGFVQSCVKIFVILRTGTEFFRIVVVVVVFSNFLRSWYQKKVIYFSNNPWGNLQMNYVEDWPI